MKIIFSKKQKDYPKKTGDLHLAWYNHGRICISRKKSQPVIQKQNIRIQVINSLCKNLWDKLLPANKKEMALYARMYKATYPGLRKRGISSYSVLLMMTHSLLNCYRFDTENPALCAEQLLQWISIHSLYQMIQMKFLKRVRYAYRLNYQVDNPLHNSVLSMQCLHYGDRVRTAVLNEKRIGSTIYFPVTYLPVNHINTS